MQPARDESRIRPEEVSRLLERHRVLASLAARQQTERRDLLEQMQRRENLAELQRYLRGGHPADLAPMLATVPPDDRHTVFGQLEPRATGLTLVELDDEVRQSVIEHLDERTLAKAVAGLDADDLAYLSPSLPAAIVRDATDALGAANRSWFIDSSAYPAGSVGRLMRRDVVTLKTDDSVDDALASLRSLVELPAQTDRVFVIDSRHLLRGSVLLQDLIRADPGVTVSSLARDDVDAFRPDDPADRAAKSFERYDLVSAPVVDHIGKLVGRLTIDAVVDHVRESSQQDALACAGLRGAEDLFAPVSESVRNRWPWLAVNLVTAFTASRVIGAFEGTIVRVVALAALMPIVASIGGNTGNQTMALVIRALALDQLHGTERRLAMKELMVGSVNGLAWGVVVGLFALLLYGSLALAGVMAGAVFLNLVVAAVAGVAVPLALRHFGRDPAQGASVVLTFVTDGMGFLLFLGLAYVFL